MDPNENQLPEENQRDTEAYPSYEPEVQPADSQSPEVAQPGSQRPEPAQAGSQQSEVAESEFPQQTEFPQPEYPQQPGYGYQQPGYPQQYPQQQMGQQPQQPGYPSGQPYGYYPPMPPQKNPRTARLVKFWVGLIIALVIVLIAGVVTVKILNSGRTAEATVEKYLQYIVDGNATAASEMVDPGVKSSERLLLTDEAFQASTERIEIVSLKSDSYGLPDQRRVTVTYTLDGERFTHDFTVVAGEKEKLFLRTWEIEDAFVVPISFDSTWFEEVSVAGVTVPLNDEDGWFEGTQYVYPGVYDVAAPAGVSEYVTLSSQAVKATGDSYDLSQYVSLEPEYSDALEELVMEAVIDQVNSCASVPGNMDSACPYSVRDKDLASLEVKELPQRLTDFSYGYFDTDEAVITIIRNPSAFDENPEPEDISFTLYGEVVLEYGQEPVVDIQGSF